MHLKMCRLSLFGVFLFEQFSQMLNNPAIRCSVSGSTCVLHRSLLVLVLYWYSSFVLLNSASVPDSKPVCYLCPDLDVHHSRARAKASRSQAQSSYSLGSPRYSVLRLYK